MMDLISSLPSTFNLCSGFSALTLHDNDFVDSGPNGLAQALLRRTATTLDIRLQCEFLLENQNGVVAKLISVHWGNVIEESSSSCGTCSFCCQILEGLRRRLDWEFAEPGYHCKNAISSPPNSVCQNIHFDRCEYRKDPASWIIGSKLVKTGEPYLIVFRGSCIQSINGGGEYRKDFDLSFEIFAHEQDPIGKLLNIHRRPLESSTLSEANVDKILAWMKECDETHDKCWEDFPPARMDGFDRSINLLPSRLVYVGNSSSHEQPRLVQSSELPKDQAEAAKYIALSYCWGIPNDSRPLLKTTRSTTSSRIAGIPVEDMPKAFQDAVKLARILNIPYVWIDSLCITQDDAQDWQKESSRMAEIFSHAYLTVVAATGASCHDSFLWRDPDCASVSIPCASSKSGSVNGQIKLRFCREWAATDKMSQISRHRWVTRGWTFQEERLARRVLMFGEDKFFFDCRIAERCEDTDRLRPRPDWVDTVYGEQEPSDAEPSTLVRRQTYSLQRAPFDHWQTLCNHYTRRDLTYEGDKLPALEGMASQIAKKVHSEYLAGLWKDNLVHDLFWQTQRRATKPQAYRAPSWSWAALEGHVRWPQWPSWRYCETGECEMFCNIQNSQTTPISHGPFGAVRGGHLTLIGAVLEVEVYWAGQGTTQNTPHPWLLRIDDETIGKGNLDLEKTEPTLKQHGRKMWAMPISRCTGRGGLPGSPRGLLLMRMDRQRDSTPEFERVGIFTLVADPPIRLNYIINLWRKAMQEAIIIV